MVKWTFGLGLYVAGMVAAYVLCGRYALQDTSLDRDTRNAAIQLSVVSKRVLTINQDMAVTQQKLQTAKAVGQQPDWSTLMSLLGQDLGDQVVLDLCRLQRSPVALGADRPAVKTDPAGKPEPPPENPFLLELNGFAKTQADVSDFVLRLEKTSLFDKVKLVRTTRQSFLNGKAVAFRLECTFGEKGPNGGTSQ